MRRDYESLYSLGVAFAAFAVAESVHGSGFLAAFAAGLTISALDVELCDCFLEYGETTAEMALLFTFVLFGASLIWEGLAILTPLTLLFALLVILARVAAFVPALAFTRLTRKEKLLISWFGPRGLAGRRRRTRPHSHARRRRLPERRYRRGYRLLPGAPLTCEFRMSAAHLTSALQRVRCGGSR